MQNRILIKDRNNNRNLNIKCIDCFEYLKQLPDNFIDLILTDPPYQISKKNKF